MRECWIRDRASKTLELRGSYGAAGPPTSERMTFDTNIKDVKVDELAKKKILSL